MTSPRMGVSAPPPRLSRQRNGNLPVAAGKGQFSGPIAMPSAALRSSFVRGCLLALLALAPVAALAAGDTSDIVVKVRKVGDTINVEVDCPLAAPRAIAWEVLTDYENMPRFIANLEQSVVRLRKDNRVLLHQKGKASRGPLTFPFENVREVELVPQTEIRSHMVSGDAMPAEFLTRIEERDGRLHVVHTGKYTPKMWVPPGVGPMLIEDETRKQYGEIRDEILRRSRAR